MLIGLETSLNKIVEERLNLSKAKELLELQEPGTYNKYDEKLRIANEELTELKSVWQEMKVLNDKIDELREKLVKIYKNFSVIF